jgi:hypothetical protein
MTQTAPGEERTFWFSMGMGKKIAKLREHFLRSPVEQSEAISFGDLCKVRMTIGPLSKLGGLSWKRQNDFWKGSS